MTLAAFRLMIYRAMVLISFIVMHISQRPRKLIIENVNVETVCLMHTDWTLLHAFPKSTHLAIVSLDALGEFQSGVLIQLWHMRETCMAQNYPIMWVNHPVESSKHAFFVIARLFNTVFALSPDTCLQLWLCKDWNWTIINPWAKLLGYCQSDFTFTAYTMFWSLAQR